MAEVRCPMCGKSNPAERDICQYCQARLRPIWETGPLKDAVSGAQPGDAADPADWLKALGGDIQNPASDQPAAQQDWLGGLRSESAEPEQEDAAVRPMDDLPGENPDWLSRIGLPGEAAPPAPEKSGDAGDHERAFSAGDASWGDFAADTGLPEPDWLRSTPQPDEWRPQPDEDLPDWLKSSESEPSDDLEGASAPEAESRAPEKENEPLPDWLFGADAGRPEAELETPAADGEDLPDWLAGARQVESNLPAEPAPAEPAPAEPAAPDEVAFPDWLLKAETPETGSVEESPAAAPEGLPEWLLSADSTPAISEESVGESTDVQPQEQETPPEWGSLLSDEDTPEWLRDAMRAETAEGEPDEEPAPAAEEFPAWMSAAEPGAAIPTEEETTLPAETGAVEDEEEDFAAWIASVGAAKIDAEPAGEPTSADSLDWMAGSGSAPEWLQEFAGEQPPAAEKPEQRPAWLPEGDEGGANVFTPKPDASEWIASIGEQADRLQAAPEEAPAEDDETDLSWLETLESSYPGLTLEPAPGAEGFGTPADDLSAEDSGLTPGDLPAWLSGETETILPAGQAAPEDVNPGELPGWLLGMKPEGLPPSEEAPASPAAVFEQVEGAGPLAGLRGALPAEPDIAQAEKPPTYSVLLQVGDTQNTQARMLADLVAGEAEAETSRGEQAARARPVFRWLATLLLSAALVFSIVTGLPVMYRPVMPPELAAVSQAVDRLESGAPVLVALDYEPGFSAEMDAATRAVVTHLLRRGAVPNFISTIPTGPMQVERLIGQIGQNEKTAYTAGAQYVNRGFLAGGATGMASFVSGSGAGETPALQAAGDLSAYRLVIVAAADPDRARGWIEQSGRMLGDTPLIMLLSAQAEPMVRPYYDAAPRQVQGLLTGLNGALIYETNTAQQGGASRAWAPFNVGLAIAITLMLVGGAYHFLTVRLSGRKAAAEVKSQ